LYHHSLHDALPISVPAIIDVGVARPRAHGHAITKIEIIGIKLARKSPGATTKYHVRNVTTAIATTIGTTTLEIRSAKRCTLACETCASSTTLTICDKAVSFPTLVAVICREPLLLIVAPITETPGTLSIGILSPVNIDSSTADCPSTISPSTGTFS